MAKENQIKWGLLGVPDHAAVTHLRGRIGAAHGPSAFRAVFQKMRGFESVQETCVDEGNVSPITDDVATNHTQAAHRIAEAHERSKLSVIVGGSHDHGFSHLIGIKTALERTFKKSVRLGCINLDAHLDVRKPNPHITSGSPFYLALEKKIIQPTDFVEFGIQRHCNDSTLWDYIGSKKSRVVRFDKIPTGKSVSLFQRELHRLRKSCDAVVVSLDLDCMAQAFAPGVSAPQAEGFTSMEILEMIRFAGRTKEVVSLGIFELNPLHDIDQGTARIASTCAFHFIAERHQLR